MTRAIAAASLLASLALCRPALAASPAATPNVLPAESIGATQAPPPQPINWDRVTQEATDLLSKYIQLDTTNPPGNERDAARMLKEKFLTDGIPATTWEPQKGRGIVAARLRGIGKHTKSIILLSHMDVVPANPKEWEVPPFSGLVKNGEIWGRGAIDDKGPGVVELMAMLAIKRAGILLNRDVLFVATGDEEEGGRNGAGWFVDHESSVFADAGFLLNEGGGIRALADNKRKVYVVSVTEKTPLWLRLTASGPAGHASDPPAETAVTRLVRALDKLNQYKTPIHVIGPVQDYYHTMATIDHGPKEQLDLVRRAEGPRLSEQVSFRSQPECARARHHHAHRALRQPEDQRDFRDCVRRSRLPAAAEQRSQDGHERHQASARRRLDQDRHDPELSADLVAVAIAPDDRD